MKTFIVAGAVFAALTVRVAFADVGTEIDMASVQAGLAAKATSLASVHQYMHRALNCLVGPKGAYFDRKEKNPCRGGNGAIPDTYDANEIRKLQSAVNFLYTGVNTTNLGEAKQDALQAQNLLETAF